MKKLRQRATIDEVKTAIASLKKQGIKPTADNIITEIVQSSNGTVGIAKGTVLKFRRVLESLDNSSLLSSVESTKLVQFNTTKSTQFKPNSLDESFLSLLESKLKVQLEAYLDNKLREQFEVYQVSQLPHNQTNEHSLEEALQEMCELWLDSITQYTVAKTNLDGLEKQVTQLNSEVQWLSKSEAQVTELRQMNERLVLENNELKSKLEAIQHERQIQNEAATNQLIQFQSTLNQAADQIEIQQSQLNQLNQDLNSLHELWLEAVFQITTPSAVASVITGTNPLENYFQAVTQLHGMTPVQKYDYAMKLFEQGMGPSEVSRILAVNKGSLQHYKDGKRKRPNNG